MQRYRLYVDESGDHALAEWQNPDDRYLGLTGIVIEDNRYRTQTHPELERLKQRFFPHNPDDPIVLVRSRLLKKRGIFKVLQDPRTAQEWEEAFIEFALRHIERIFTVVIDKQSHRDKYGDAAWNPYHYCLKVLFGQYRGWMREEGGQGDILAESRGRREDKNLQHAYKEVWAASEIGRQITSKEIKIKKKEANIAGLQLADCIAYPSKLDVIQSHGRALCHPPSPASIRINTALQDKYNPDAKHLL